MIKIILFIFRNMPSFIIPGEMQKLISTCHPNRWATMIKPYIPVKRKRRIDICKIRDVFPYVQWYAAKIRF